MVHGLPVWGYSNAVRVGDWQTPSDYSCIKCCTYSQRIGCFPFPTSVFFLSFLAFSCFQPPWHTHTDLSMWVMSDNLWSVPQVVQSQTKTHQFWTNVCLSSSTLIRFPHLSIRFHPLSLLSLAIVCLSFSCLTCCLSTLCPLDLIHVKLSCSCNAHLARSYFLPPLTFFIILTFCVSVFVRCQIILHLVNIHALELGTQELVLIQIQFNVKK